VHGNADYLYGEAQNTPPGSQMRACTRPFVQLHPAWCSKVFLQIAGNDLATAPQSVTVLARE